MSRFSAAIIKRRWARLARFPLIGGSSLFFAFATCLR